jgi:hypothetical protein
VAATGIAFGACCFGNAGDAATTGTVADAAEEELGTAMGDCRGRGASDVKGLLAGCLPVSFITASKGRAARAAGAAADACKDGLMPAAALMLLLAKVLLSR